MLAINQELNGIEITFESKPEAATLEALKAAGYRWHKVKKLWYAKNTPDRLQLAKAITGGEPITAQPARRGYNLEGLGVGTLKHGAELAAAIREDLKKRGVDGVTVRARRVTYDTGITLTIKATAADFVSIEEGAERFTYGDFLQAVTRWNSLYTNGRYITASDLDEMTEEEKENARRVYIAECLKKFDRFNFGNYRNNERADFWELTSAFFEKCRAAYLIANQWNYNNSDSMTDYYDVGYYLDVDIKKPDDFTPRQEMTEEDRATLEKEREEEARKQEESRKKYEEERKAAEEAAAKYKAWEEAATAAIYKNIEVGDIAEENQIYITNIFGGIGKESTLDELMETLNTHDRKPEAAVITRKVNFISESAFNDFCKLFLNDFTFLDGKGGTGTEDARIPETSDYMYYSKLTQEQRETIQTYNADCIGIYLYNDLQFIINPQGYSYARYVYIPGTDSKQTNAAEELKRQREESEKKPAFYIPEPVENQVEAIKPGEAVTIYQCDGWILNSIYAGAGIVEEVTAGTYAQYNGVYITLTDGKKARRVFIRNNKECLIYAGILPKLPDEVTGRQISANMREMFNYNELLPNAYNYYKTLGKLPILDTLPK